MDISEQRQNIDTASSSITSARFSRNDKRQFRSRETSQILLVNAIKQRLKVNIATPLSMDAIAKEMCLSPRTLSRKLNTINCHYRDLKAEVMIERACDYLTNTSEPINSIARLLGYNDPSNFCKAFKRRLGKTPATFRKHSDISF